MAQDEWLTVDSLDLDAQGVARRQRWQGGLHRRRLARRSRHLQHRAQQEPLGAGRDDRAAARKLAARAPGVPALRPACRRLRRLQDAAPAPHGAGGDQAARAGRQPVAPGQGQARPVAAADRRPGLGLPPPRAAVGAPCGQEGHGAGGFPRAQIALRGRHAGLPGAARQGEPHADAAARTDRRDGSARPAAADRTGRRRRSHCAGAAPPGAVERGRPAAAARLRRRARRAMVVAAEGAGQRAPAATRAARTGLCAARVRCSPALQAHRLHAGQCRHQRRAGGPCAAPARRCSPTSA